MADSPTRRSSIPILKQTNKTKSFQSFVNLKIIDDQDPNGRIHSPASMSSLSPQILECPKVPPKPQARTVAQLPKLEIDNDIIITKLCEENKRIKEHQTQLLSKYEEALRENMEIQNKNEELQKEIAQAKREISEKIHLQKTVENLMKQQTEMVERNKKLQKKLEEMLPDRINDFGDLSTKSPAENSNSELGNIMNELEKLKSYLTNVELQLYEANENIADLLEKKQEIEVENVSTKFENSQLKDIVKLMQANLAVEAKRKEENYSKPGLEELIKMNHDIREKGGETASESYILKREQSQQKRSFEAQFIEYV